MDNARLREWAKDWTRFLDQVLDVPLSLSNAKGTCNIWLYLVHDYVNAFVKHLTIGLRDVLAKRIKICLEDVTSDVAKSIANALLRAKNRSGSLKHKLFRGVKFDGNENTARVVEVDDSHIHGLRTTRLVGSYNEAFRLMLLLNQDLEDAGEKIGKICPVKSWKRQHIRVDDTSCMNRYKLSLDKVFGSRKILREKKAGGGKGKSCSTDGEIVSHTWSKEMEVWRYLTFNESSEWNQMNDDEKREKVRLGKFFAHERETTCTQGATIHHTLTSLVTYHSRHEHQPIIQKKKAQSTNRYKKRCQVRERRQR